MKIILWAIGFQLLAAYFLWLLVTLIVHRDIKPTNIMVSLKDEAG